MLEDIEAVACNNVIQNFKSRTLKTVFFTWITAIKLQAQTNIVSPSLRKKYER